ncbi:unnamed protein product [Mytilus coruscus]|uniref:Reverse transcriptase/retrotransposon-derived protein RNase H-like domain-containing protein n=1 Tax=Mytilus coruscus TaxID=42192 RepID=A0A6J8AYA5_MYTCO|nr:unnamed protein product [Mytilus coruscus]
MAYFDPRKATVLIVDASAVGVGALLTQDGKFNAYASCALSDVENRYTRIQRWRLRLQTYDFDVKYKSGKSNAADYMSRHPNINEANRTDHYDVAEEFVNYISENAIPKAMTIEEIALESKADTNIQYIIKAVKSGSWENSYDNKTLDTFSRLKNELTIVNTDKGEILMHDNRIVIPHKLTDRFITLAHERSSGNCANKTVTKGKSLFPE